MSKQQIRVIIFKSLFLLILIISSFSIANAKTAPEVQEEQVTENKALDSIEKSQETIKEIKERLADQAKSLKQEQTDEGKQNIQDRIDYLERQLNEEHRNFEKLALGGVNPAQLAISSSEENTPYNWQDELLQIVQPVFAEFQRMTATMREKDDLIRHISDLNSKINELEKGLNNLDILLQNDLKKETNDRLIQLQSNWASYLRDLQRQHDSYSNALDEITEKRSYTTRVIDGIKSFATGRGLILLVSFTTFFGILFLLTKLIDFVISIREEKRDKRDTRASLKWRLLLLFLRLFAFLISLIAFLLVLHSMGDMVLFGLAILILMIVLFVFRNYLPRYISELRLFLNLGSARQGERIIYNGLPWKIQRINLYSAYLVNPSLDNGYIRLLHPELINLTSRPIRNNEVWFPSEVGDRLIMPNGTFVEVTRQTPESVYLNAFNREIIYPSAEFYAAKPENISKAGYYVTVNFGLDLKHADLEIDEVIDKIKHEVINFLDTTDLKDEYESISVDFREVSHKSSLIYTIIILMKGSSADWYYTVGRKVQQACLRCAQKNNWSLPHDYISYKDIENNNQTTDKLDQN